jgi:hypothetical protein
MSTTISQLAPEAHLRLVPVAEGLTDSLATPLLAVLRELIAHWQNNRAIIDGAVELMAGGAFIAIAYQPKADDLSGCTKDQLAHTLLQFEKQLGIPILNAPNLAVEIDGRVRLLDRDEFRRLRAEGTINEATIAYDHLIDRVGDLGRFRTTVGESWYNRIGKPKTPTA